MTIKNINDYIKELRSLADLTQEEASKLIGMDRQNYRNRESGKVAFSAEEFFEVIKALSKDLHPDTINDWLAEVLDRQEIKINSFVAHWIELITNKRKNWSNGLVTPELFPEYRNLVQAHETLKIKYESDSDKFELQKGIIEAQQQAIESLKSAIDLAQKRIQELEKKS